MGRLSVGPWHDNPVRTAMGTILFNAFSFLQKRLKEKNRPCTNVSMAFDEGTTVRDLLREMDIGEAEVEGVFVNGKITTFDTLLRDGDRVAAFPPGTPGPYRLLLGIVTPDNAPPDQGEP